jgi:hypothetical protein
MDQYSILDNTSSQAGTKTAPSSPEPTTQLVSAAGVTREGLHFPGEDGGKSLSQMAQRDLDATLQLLAERAQYITGASGAAIALHKGEAMICCASAGPSAPVLGTQLQVESGLSAESVRTRQTLCCDDAETDPRVNRESCRSFGIASVVVMPLLREGEVYGVFELLSGSPRAFGERDLVALERLAEMIQTAIDHAEAARRVEQELNQKPEPATANMKVAPAPGELPAGPATGTSATDSPKTASTPEAIRTNLIPPLAPAPGRTADAMLADLLELAAEQSQTPGSSIQSDPPVPVRYANIGKCEACGFPVSPGRSLCLDCEAVAPGLDSSGPAPLSQFAEPEVGWIRSHLYLVAALLAVAATIAVLAWRL